MSILLYNVKQGQPYRVPTETIAADATTTLDMGVVFIGGGSATTVTLPDPPNDDGLRLTFVAITAQAHVIDNSAGSGFNGAGAGSDVATFTAAIGNGITVISYNGAWYVEPGSNLNGTLA